MITKADYIRKFREWGKVFPNQYRRYESTQNEYSRLREEVSIAKFNFHLYTLLQGVEENESLPEQVDDPKTLCLAIQEWLKTTSFYREHYEYLQISIAKSDCLARLIYEGEEVRTTPCPYHGNWNNEHWDSRDPRECCDGTRWLPND